MIASLREHQFDTVLGPIDFDDKGDLTVQSPVLYVWHADGTYVPLEQTWPRISRTRRARQIFPHCRRVEARAQSIFHKLEGRSWSVGDRLSSASLPGCGALRSSGGGRDPDCVAGPMTGLNAWFGEQFERGAELAVADLNAEGGVLGQRSSWSWATTSAIPIRRSPLHASWSATAWSSSSGISARTPRSRHRRSTRRQRSCMIAPGLGQREADRGRRPERVSGVRARRPARRDGRRLPRRHWAGKEIAVLDDGTTWGAGVADGVRRRLRERGRARGCG